MTALSPPRLPAPSLLDLPGELLVQNVLVHLSLRER